MPRPIPPEHRAGMVREYLSGKSMKDAAAVYGYTPRACFGSLKLAGVPSREHNARPSDEVKRQMVEAYLSGKTETEAAAPFGYSRSACKAALREAGVAHRGRSECRRVYRLNESFFRDGPPELRCYVAGFIAADGCVTGNKEIVINLAVRDREHLGKIASAVGWTGPILSYHKVKDGKTYTICRLGFRSAPMAADLATFGVIPAKSKTIRPWDGPDDLLRHYYRGVFDGDGAIYHDKRDIWLAKLVGSKWMCQGFADFIGRRLGFRAAVQAHSGIFKVSFGGVVPPREVARLLYDGAAISLDRKRLLYEELLRREPKQKDWRGLTREDLETLHTEHGSWSAACKAIGIDRGHLNDIRHRLGMPNEESRLARLTAEELSGLYDRLGTWTAVADHLGMDQANMPRLRRRLGVEYSNRKYSHVTLEQLDSLFGELGSWTAVAKHLGILPSNLHRLKRKLSQP